MKRVFFAIFFVFTSIALMAQEGSPLLTHFRENRDIENQNWAICQDTDRVMLFANRRGVHAFDGSDWTPVRTTVIPFVMKSSPFTQRIYTGGENNYGFLEKDRNGIYNYVKLSEDSVGMITRILFSDSLALFCSDLSISCYNTNTQKLHKRFVADPGSRFTGTFIKGADLFINVAGKGLHRIDADTLFPIVTGYLTENAEILFSLPYDKSRIALGMNNNRITLFDGIKYYDYPLDDAGYLSANVLSDGIAVGDSLYAFSTLGGGAVIVEKTSGKVRFYINNQMGLPDDEIFAIGSDDSGGLWLSHPLGLTRTDLRLPVRNFSIYTGLTGNLSASLRFENELYVATSEGVFWLANEKSYTEVSVIKRSSVDAPEQIRLPAGDEVTTPLIAPARQENPKKGIINRIFGKKETFTEAASASGSFTPKQSSGSITIRNVPDVVFTTEKVKKLKSIDHIFRKVGGINEKCRQLVPTPYGILAATNRGLFVIRNHQSTAIVPDRYINHISWQPEKGNYFVAASDGWFSVSAPGGKWKATIPDPDFSDPVYSVVSLNDSILWLGCDNKVLMARMNNSVVSYRRYNVENSFPQRYLVDHINDTLFLLTETSIYCYVNSTDGFLPYKLPAAITLDEFRYPLSNVPVIPAGDRYILPGTDGRNDNNELLLLNLFDEVISVYSGDGKTLIIDGNNNLYEIDSEKSLPGEPETAVIIKNVSNEKGVFFDISDVVFERGDNVINFEIAVPAYLNKEVTEYQYYIDKVMPEWSPWSTRTNYSKGIPRPGNYTLLVRARDLWGNVGEPEAVEFTIKASFTQTTAFFVLLIMSGFFAFSIVVRFREKSLNEKNRILEEKVRERTAEIEAQKEEITSSITYASRIQMAMLPATNLFADSFSDYFIIFRPRNIVSGDFYWIGKDRENIYFTVADCTGHGVPGAFMSTLGISILNEIITHNNDLKANKFLSLLRSRIKVQLHQTGKFGEAADGMDISLCVLDKKKEILQFSGAFNPLYIMTDGVLQEFRADRMPIGIHYGVEGSFTNNRIDVKNGDVIYLLTDGMTDQFGGPEGSKYKKARFKKLLTEIHHRPLSEQKKIIELEFLRWKSSHEQIDDVTVIGVRI